MAENNTMARTKGDLYVELLKQIIKNQFEQNEAFEEFKEEVLEKLDNLSVPGDGFSTFDT
jgi:hypothetical protein